MSKYSNAKELVGLSLGQETVYSNQYDPSLLQGVPRKLNREDIQIQEVLPFKGVDIWTLYELSWLNDNGLPQVAIGEVSLPATSSNLIESKSFKLYLNSYNQTRFSDWDEVKKTLTKDLSECAGETVDVTINPITFYDNQPIVSFLGDCIDHQDIKIESYEFDPTLLQNATSNEQVSETLVSNLLKSNCLITNQPDWGSIFIKYSGKRINRESMLRYLVSFREHNEFHEQCVERIFTDIKKFCAPSSLTVFARYTRRGGLDINPYRSTEQSKPDNHLRLARQ